MKSREHYFDYNATTPVDERVLEKMSSYFHDRFHNPSSFYRTAREARMAVEEARENLAKAINASPEEIFFTSGGTESDNLAIKGVVARYHKKDCHIITSGIEHPAVKNTTDFLKKEGYPVTELGVNSKGRVNPDDLKKNIRKNTRLVSVMTANNETGVIQPIAELARICHDHGVLFHTDGVQALGKIAVDVKAMGLDMATFSSHKIYGPKGVGILYRRKGIRIVPMIHGGGHEKGLRNGTENVSGIVGFGEAARLVITETDQFRSRIEKMRNRIEKELMEKIPRMMINGDVNNRLFNTLNISAQYIEGESIIALLEQYNIAISSGSACSSKSLEPSHTLLAMGLSHEDAHGSLRISLGKYNNDEDVDRLIEVLPGIVQSLRERSPLWKG
jgi:cysteine desulfurase